MGTLQSGEKTHTQKVNMQTTKPLILSILTLVSAEALEVINTGLGTVSVGLSIIYTVYKFSQEKRKK